MEVAQAITEPVSNTKNSGFPDFSDRESNPFPKCCVIFPEHRKPLCQYRSTGIVVLCDLDNKVDNKNIF